MTDTKTDPEAQDSRRDGPAARAIDVTDTKTDPEARRTAAETVGPREPSM